MIRSVEYENAMLSSEEMRLASLLETVRSLSSLTVLSLPDCIDVAANQTVADDLNACLKVRYGLAQTIGGPACCCVMLSSH